MNAMPVAKYLIATPLQLRHAKEAMVASQSLIEHARELDDPARWTELMRRTYRQIEQARRALHRKTLSKSSTTVDGCTSVRGMPGRFWGQFWG